VNSDIEQMNATEPKLDKSLPKEQIFFLVLAFSLEILVSLGTGYFLFGANTFGPETIACVLLGAFLGSFSFGRKGNFPALTYGMLLTIVALAPMSAWIYLQSARPTIILLASSWCPAFVAISCYHSLAAGKND
jgi:hypothetical protein